MSLSPMNAIVVGWARPEATISTRSPGSLTVCAAAGEAARARSATPMHDVGARVPGRRRAMQGLYGDPAARQGRIDPRAPTRRGWYNPGTREVVRSGAPGSQ